MGLLDILFGRKNDRGAKLNEALNEGIKFFNNEQYEQAIPYFTEALRIDIYNPKAHNLRGICYHYLSKYNNAITDFTLAIRYDHKDNYKIYYFNRGLAYLKSNDLLNSLKDFQESISLGQNYNEIKNIIIDHGYFKNNWKNFELFLSEKRIKSLYHFTDKRNLDSIIKNKGLYSWFFSIRNNIKIPQPGGNNLSRDLDYKKNVHDYVRLSFNKNHPMLYVALREGRIRDPVFLEISTDVIFFKDTLFSSENATSSSSKIGGNLEDLKRIDFNLALLGEWKNGHEKKIVQAEVLVKTYIPLMFIKNLGNNG